MKACLLLVCVALLLSAVPVRAQDDANPYLYYFSPMEYAFVVERADGTRHHHISDSYDVHKWSIAEGPGWSPDGAWFAWTLILFVEYPISASGGATNVYTGIEPRPLNDLAEIWALHWSPDSRLLLVEGRTWSCAYESVCRTYRLIDVVADRTRASLDLICEIPGSATAVVWLPGGEGVVFYAVDAITGSVRITMETNGRVTKEPPDPGEIDAVSTPQPDRPMWHDDAHLVSPSGRYDIRINDRTLTDTLRGTTVTLPEVTMLEGSIISEAKWYSSEEWVILGYRVPDWGTRVAAVYNVLTQEQRVLSFCGFSEACVGWLPETVDVSRIPPLPGTPP